MEGKVDPDYVSYNSAVELNEEEDKRQNLIKLKKIIEEEYNREITQRQEQIEQIELQICKVRKVLHLLRFALIKTYYKKKELENSEDETTSDFLIPDKQNRIHPAIKKLLGKNLDNLSVLNIRDKRKSNARNADLLSTPETKRIKLNEVPPPETRVKNENFEVIRNRKKTKYRVVVGNISKWMPSSEDDALTHKWMVYVRGPKDNPDVSHFIEKVVFYLHPSYKPHDVVEVCESPFHLSRRGWGEFPVRVQIFFKIKLNKPIDVVHNIKLDKTYSGRQILGNETIIDVFLYNIETEKIEECIESEEITTETEHDYCTEIAEVKNDISFIHSYCLAPGLPKPQKEKIHQDESNALIYGLDSYIENKHNFKKFIELNRKDIKFNNTKIIVFGKKMEGSFLTNFGKLIQVPNRQIIKDGKIKVSVPPNKFKNMGEVLPYFFKRLPLFTDLANNAYYKRFYPFTASSLKEFLSWNVGKRRSSEWSRARTIRKLLLAEKIEGIEQWNTKSILMYGRSHDYTPCTSYGLFTRQSEEKQLLMCCYSGYHKKVVKIEEEDVTVNVDSDETAVKKTEPVIDITDPHTRLECSYIKQAALNSGVILKPEEIIDGVKVNGAEMMILEAVKCLADNLIRRAKNYRVCTGNFNSSIGREDVEAAINERPEMWVLRQKNQFS